jgi:hypothetical protein
MQASVSRSRKNSVNVRNESKYFVRSTSDECHKRTVSIKVIPF